jgi:uncharacterized protein YcfJ
MVGCASGPAITDRSINTIFLSDVKGTTTVFSVVMREIRRLKVKVYQFGAVLLAAGFVVLPATANDVYYDTARVVHVTPVTERVNSPRQECHAEYIQESYRSGGRDNAGAIIGGIAGGLIGSQVGKGNGRVAAAAVGAATGAIVGDRIGNSPGPEYGNSTRQVERCTMVDNWQTVNRGYNVIYRFNDRTYTTMMPYEPGNTIRIRITVSPDVDRQVSYLETAYRHDNGRHLGWYKKNRGRDWGD